MSPSRSSAPRSVALAATFALGDLSALLGLALEGTGLTVTRGPYHQVLAAVHDPSGVLSDPSTEASLIPAARRRPGALRRHQRRSAGRTGRGVPGSPALFGPNARGGR
ncbi:hypothetical protein LV779_14980 [Streptomyces thinghirensis]|nr:hypothetical protein [Streptomyces thinghirensis]